MTQEMPRLHRLTGDWLCGPCDDKVVDRAAVGGGMPTASYLPRMALRWVARSDERRTATCGLCGVTGWYPADEEPSGNPLLWIGLVLAATCLVTLVLGAALGLLP